MENNKEHALLFINGDAELTKEFLNDLLHLSMKYGIEFNNGFIYKKDKWEFGEQYRWSEYWIEIDNFI